MKTVVGIIGPNRAGKDTAATYLSEKLVLPRLQISAPLHDLSVERGQEPTRGNLIKLGTELALEHGDDYLARLVLQAPAEELIVTGMRQLGQIATFRDLSNFSLIAVNAAPEVRFQRSILDPKPGEADNLTEFIAREAAENSAPHAQRLFECMESADITVSNNGTVAELHESLDFVINAVQIR